MIEGTSASVLAEAEVEVTEFEADKDEFVVMACDGLWDVMTSQEVVDFVRQRRKLQGSTKAEIQV